LFELLILGSIGSIRTGNFILNVTSELLQTVDVRMQVQDIPHQIVLTKDNVSLTVDSVLYWEMIDPFTATFLVTNVQKALIDRTQTTVRSVLGNRTLQDTTEHRESAAQEIKDEIDLVAESWGVRVESILLKELILGADILNSISAAATQKRIGESKVIAAQAEVQASKLMREAADILNHPAAMQIRYLETLQNMSQHAVTKVIFMPMTDKGVSNKEEVDKS
jgi:erythrocyte band 7 integral membrane protein